MQQLQRLPLVLVQPLDHHVEQVALGQVDAVAGAQDGVEPGLVLLLGLAEGASEVLVLRVRLELGQPVEVGHPADADGVGDQVGEERVRELDEPARGDAIGHVGELVREEL